jgi:RNA polymerase subunit RPABC4/transcription elongation factor Spt4
MHKCASCRERQRVLDGYSRHCPVCGAAAFYAPEFDRFVHADGSTNTTCWVELSRGAS